MLGRLRGLLAMFLAGVQSLATLLRTRPVVALGMGGYVAGPAGFAAWLLRIPLVIHEQNSVAGTTNRLLQRFARAVLTAYPGAFGEVTTRQVGNPVREELLSLGEATRYEFDGHRPLRLLVVGGSLGALAINNAVPAALKQVRSPVEVKHQTGPAHREHVEALYGDSGPQVDILAYIEDMASVYDWADLVLCRAGALTVSELAVMGRPALLVPLPHAIDDHQSAQCPLSGSPTPWRRTAAAPGRAGPRRRWPAINRCEQLADRRRHGCGRWHRRPQRRRR